MFWHLGGTTEDVIERARVIALTPIKAEEAVVRVEVEVEIEVEVVEISPEAKDEDQDHEQEVGQEQELNPIVNSSTTMKSEYDDTGNNMETTRSEQDCEKISE